MVLAIMGWQLLRLRFPRLEVQAQERLEVQAQERRESQAQESQGSQAQARRELQGSQADWAALARPEESGGLEGLEVPGEEEVLEEPGGLAEEEDLAEKAGPARSKLEDESVVQQ